jgi:hypothetical protein
MLLAGRAASSAVLVDQPRSILRNTCGLRLAGWRRRLSSPRSRPKLAAMFGIET